MKKKLFCISIFLVALGTFGLAGATPLSLGYLVTDLGNGFYDYEFELVLDNNDNSWAAGQGWRWFIFGDALSSSSPLTDFVGDIGDLPVGPWGSFSHSFGGHNGPTLSDVLDYWVPLSIGDALSWSGTSSANLGQGELLFSTISGTLNGGVAAYYEVANRVSSVPEPGTMLLFGAGVVGIMGTRIRKKAE